MRKHPIQPQVVRRAVTINAGKENTTVNCGWIFVWKHRGSTEEVRPMSFSPYSAVCLPSPWRHLDGYVLISHPFVTLWWLANRWAFDDRAGVGDWLLLHPLYLGWQPKAAYNKHIVSINNGPDKWTKKQLLTSVTRPLSSDCVFARQIVHVSLCYR